MTDFIWPDDLVPHGAGFRLQPHTGGSESPFSRVTKVYELSAARWTCQMTLSGGDSARWGLDGVARYGPRLDALIAKLRGRANRVALFDFRRDSMSDPAWPSGAGNEAAAKGATTLVITGLPPGTIAYAGDYIGGDGRPHLILDDAVADGSGEATVTFEPALAANIAADEAGFGKAYGWFRLTSDEAERTTARSAN